MKKGHIFIQCASYRDPELKETIRSAFDNANSPGKVWFGICWQGLMNELHRDLYLAKMNRCRTVIIQKNSSKGIGYARHKAQLMYEDEEYTLQIDSHMRFMPGWDSMCIEMLEGCPSRRPCLTAYLSDYAKKEDPFCWRLGATEFDHTGNITITGINPINAKHPQLGILISGHFLFAHSELFQKMPIDPNMQFLYEETLMAPRAWTSGWDIFYPHIAPLQHKWDRDYRATNWQDMNTLKQEAYCQELYKQLVGVAPGYHNFGIYGMGDVRTLEEYQEFSGINFKTMTLTDSAIKGFPATK